MVLGLIPVGKLVTCSNDLGAMQNQNLFPPSVKYNHSFAWVLGSDDEGRWTPWPSTGLGQNTLLVFQSNPRYPRRGNINGDALRTPKRQERAMDNRRNSGARKKAKLNWPCYRPENVKTLLPVQGFEQQDFEGLLWGQRIWAPQPVSNNKPKSPAEKENVWGWLRKAHSY